MSTSKIGVYQPNQPSALPALRFISIEEARELKKTGAAFFIKHGKAIRLLEKTIVGSQASEVRYKGKSGVRGESCNIDEPIMNRFVDNDWRAIIAVLAYRPRRLSVQSA